MKYDNNYTFYVTSHIACPNLTSAKFFFLHVKNIVVFSFTTENADHYKILYLIERYTFFKIQKLLPGKL